MLKLVTNDALAITVVDNGTMACREIAIFSPFSRPLILLFPPRPNRLENYSKELIFYSLVFIYMYLLKSSLFCIKIISRLWIIVWSTFLFTRKVDELEDLSWHLKYLVWFIHVSKFPLIIVFKCRNDSLSEDFFFIECFYSKKAIVWNIF